MIETTTSSIALIARRVGIDAEDLRRLARERRWSRPVRPDRAVNRARLVRRLWNAADRQVADIEEKLAAAAIDPVDQERVSRTLASVVKTIHDLARIDDTRRAAAQKEMAADEPPPIDADDLRRRLAERIARLGGS